MDAHLGPLALPNFKGYFVVQFDQPPMGMKTYVAADSSRGAYAEFKPGQTIQVRIGTSFISIEQARENLMREIPAWGFRAVQESFARYGIRSYRNLRSAEPPIRIRR
jgi:putative alpha-1,2-mannosidase